MSKSVNDVIILWKTAIVIIAVSIVIILWETAIVSQKAHKATTNR